MNSSSSRVAMGETVETAFASLELCLEEFLEKAPVRHISELYELIPDIAPANQRLIMIELIKVDMAIADELGIPRRIEFYLMELGERLRSDQVPLDLVLEEIQLRRNAGEEPPRDEYVARFPHLEAPLREMLRTGESSQQAFRLGKPPELKTGQQIDDFSILNYLGRGAFASVYLARQESMQRLVALKVTVRAGEEPQALAQLDHPNIVRVYDQRSCLEPKCLLLYMQYISGGTLADVISSQKQSTLFSGDLLVESIDRSLLAANQMATEMSAARKELLQMDWPTLVAHIGVQLAEGVGYAHSRGVLHRDIKPANVLLTADGVPKLVDFNVSHSGLNGRAGAAAHFGGSLAYMSPEQLRVADPADEFSAELLDCRSDLYSLSVLLWELWQGKRPWETPSSAESWSAAIEYQRTARSQAPTQPYRYGGAAERVLERALRKALQSNRDLRPSSGKEFAGRLRLALYPSVAERFEPQENSLAGWILRLPVLLTAAGVIFLPNVAAGAFNFYVNNKMMNRYTTVDPGLIDKFHTLAIWMNSVFFPLGAAFLIYFAGTVSKALRSAQKGEPATEEALTDVWNLGTRAAVIGGLLWSIAGVMFPLFLSNWSEHFTNVDAWHFFISHALCGGVAWIYPFFGLTMVSVLVYYPRLVSPTMTDSGYPARARSLCKKIQWYLISAAVIPLTAMALLVAQSEGSKVVLLSTVLTTALGLFAAFAAYQRLETALREMSSVLGTGD
jgi:eukaryotic-like serine/threonine-protein kinase